MKTVISILIVCVFYAPAFGAWYVVKEGGQVVARVDYTPCVEDLALRGEISVWSEAGIPLADAEYSQGEIRVRRITQEEIRRRQAEQKAFDERRAIEEELRKMALERLDRK